MAVEFEGWHFLERHLWMQKNHGLPAVPWFIHNFIGTHLKVSTLLKIHLISHSQKHSTGDCFKQGKLLLKYSRCPEKNTENLKDEETHDPKGYEKVVEKCDCLLLLRPSHARKWYLFIKVNLQIISFSS